MRRGNSLGKNKGQGGGRRKRVGRGRHRGGATTLGGGSRRMDGKAVLPPLEVVPTFQRRHLSSKTDGNREMLKKQAEGMAYPAKAIHERARQLEQRGSTRVMVAKVDSEKCTGCGICANMCPVEAVSLENGLAKIDEQRCTGCGICVQNCPQGALSLGGRR